MPETSTAKQMPCWHFDSIPAGGMERASITGEFFSKNTPLESVIREGIQNSLDAHAEGKGAVKVRVYFSDIGATSLPAADYAKYLAGAESHLANPKNGLNNKPGPDESCVYLVLEDFNTNGLSGNVEERPPVAVEKFNRQNLTLKVKAVGAFHDRSLILDDKELYYFGASLKDLGRQYTAQCRRWMRVYTVDS